jgi:hypothetical protein
LVPPIDTKNALFGVKMQNYERFCSKSLMQK